MYPVGGGRGRDAGGVECQGVPRPIAIHSPENNRCCPGPSWVLCRFALHHTRFHQGPVSPPPRQPASPSFDDLKIPDMSPRSLLRHFGPGMILMMTGIGTSHLVTAPTAGGRFEYALLWCIPVAYVFKYYGFELAFRFTNATGKSLMSAYATSWGKLPVWYVLVTTIVQCAVGQAGRLIAAAAVFYYLFTVTLGLPVSLTGWAAVIGIGSVIILLRGQYAALEAGAKIAGGLLFISAVVVYFVRPAPIGELSRFLVFDAPEGSWLVIAAFLGLLPTGIDVSLQASEWGKAQRAGMARIRGRLEEAGLARTFDPFAPKVSDLTVDVRRFPERALEYSRRCFRISLWDFRLGHVVSFVIATIFVLLSAVWLYPSPVEGRAVMGEIAGIFTESVGPWMMVVFMVGAFAATFSTAFNYFDGWPRIVGACARNLFPKTAALEGIAADRLTAEHRRRWYSEYNIYRATMLFSLVTSVALIAGVPRPVFLVLVASALAYFVAPVIFCLNFYYCLKVIPKDDPYFYPTPFARALTYVSIVVFTGLSLILILARVFGVTLFG